MGGVGVVIDSVLFMRGALHLIGCRTLFSKMDHCLRLHFLKQGQYSMIMFRDINVLKANFLSGDLLPSFYPFMDGLYRCKRVAFELNIYFPPGKIIDNNDVIPLLGKV